MSATVTSVSVPLALHGVTVRHGRRVVVDAVSLDVSREVLRGLGLPATEVRTTVETFARHDERRLTEHYKFYTDEEKMMELARSDGDTLTKLFEEDQAAAVEAAQAAEAEAGEAKAAQRRQKAKAG